MAAAVMRAAVTCCKSCISLGAAPAYACCQICLDLRPVWKCFSDMPIVPMGLTSSQEHYVITYVCDKYMRSDQLSRSFEKWIR